ncbi:vanin-like protein 2 [Leguminivora glycinivorella]|uniref:vanin-like protein 2 n=1 Tax=Leguminivora glycinivorella TaxID=1035111 RepID=UPI00200CC873|nr:vanin-like protein 2 [Leguminivora glycinivorella]
MGSLLNTVIVFLLVGLTQSSRDTYRAGVASSQLGFDAYAHLVQNAAKANVDILVLPVPEDTSALKVNFDEAVKIISSLANDNKMYVVSHLLEKMRCQGKMETVRSNLVFDRQGSVISVYRKLLNPSTVCNLTTTEATFLTDFGVTFGVLMPEDLVLSHLQGKNFVVTGEWHSEIPVLSAPQFFKSWAFATNANLVSSSGVFAGKAGETGHGTDIVVAELKKNGEGTTKAPFATSSPYVQDLSQFTVCHDQFCCHFHVKTSASGNQDLNFGLAAFEGVRHYGGGQNIGTQECALLPCAGGSKNSCDIGSINNTNVIFNEISITANFKPTESAQFPIILATNTLSNSQFHFDSKSENNTNQVTIKLYDAQNLLNFGIFGRDFSKDYVNHKTVIYDNDGLTYKIYEYINSDEVLEFCDYLWIRLRVLIFVVSIYVLEMM